MELGDLLFHRRKLCTVSGLRLHEPAGNIHKQDALLHDLYEWEVDPSWTSCVPWKGSRFDAVSRITQHV
jgi:hypothetical protein